MKVEIRAFAIEDHAGACAVWQLGGGVGVSSADSFDSITRFLSRNPGLSFVATDGGAVVATILCGHDGRRGFIHHLAVLPNYRRQGLGRALLQRALAGLRNEGISKSHLLVFHDNAAGREFWRKVGAEERMELALFSITI